jgi:hypothetical protein
MLLVLLSIRIHELRHMVQSIVKRDLHNHFQREVMIQTLSHLL